MCRSQLWNALQQIIAAQNPFEGELRMQFLIARRGILNRGDNWLQLLFRLFELLMELDDLLERRDLLLRLPRLIERRNQLVRMRDSFAAQLDWLRFFRGNRKGAARFQLLLGRFPPAFPFRLGENVADEPVANLLRAGLPIEAFQNVSNDSDRIFFRQILYRAEIARLACEKMFLGNNGEIVRCILELHRMRFFPTEIDDDLIEEEVPLGHAAETPTFVQAKRARLEFIELIGGFRGQLSRFNQFLQFRVHARSNKLR